MPRVPRNRANFDAKGPIIIMNNMTMNHFVPTVKRNEDLYVFVATRDCVIEKVFVHVSSIQDIDDFSLERYVQHGEDLIRKVYEIKKGMNPFVDGATILSEGDVVRFDIMDIDSVYTNIGSITMGILLSNRMSL